MANIETLKVDTFNWAEASAPSTPSSGQAVTWASTAGHLFEKDDAGVEKIMTFSGASVYHATTQSVNNDSATALVFDTERFDTDAYHSTSVNTGRMTIPASFTGIYSYGANVRFPVDADGYRTLCIRKNGTDFLPGFCRVMAVTTASIDTTLNVSGIFSLTAADYIEVVVKHTAGAALTMPASSTTSGVECDFWIYRLR